MMSRIKNKLLARIITRFPGLVDVEKLASRIEPIESVSAEGIPWTPVTKPLNESKVALVTTSGVHLKSQKPYDMVDPDGDPTYRVMPGETPLDDYMITHDYYDHTDADRDINVVFPVTRLAELVEEGVLGSVGPRNYSCMGHITGVHVETLMSVSAPEIARSLVADGVDVVILTPG
jgi:D-proline reductase (dithiol) PrdB